MMLTLSNLIILDALKKNILSTDNTPIVLGMDFGDGQCCIHLKAGETIYRLVLDAAETRYMLSAMALIDWEHPHSHNTIRTALISNNALEYETLRSMDSITLDELNRKLSSTSFRSLLMDMIFLLAAYGTGDTLYFPLPESCPATHAAALMEAVQEMLHQLQANGEPRYALLASLTHVCQVRADYSRLFQDFKRSPRVWNKCIGRFKGKDICCRELMSAYNTALLRNAVLCNPDLFYALYTQSADTPDSPHLRDFLRYTMFAHLHAGTPYETADANHGYRLSFRIALGCPASPAFLEDNASAYCLMLQGVCVNVGFPSLVEIVPEPCAALLPHVTGAKDSTPDVSKGTATIDLGAYSADATMIYYGPDKTYRISISSNRFGGAQIEKRMLDVLLEDAYKTLSPSQRDLMPYCENSDYLELYLRTVKEAYYPNREDNAPRSLTLALTDGVGFSRAVTITFTPGDLLARAIRLPYRHIGSQSGATKCWFDYAHDFLQAFFWEIHQALGYTFQPDTLVLTGGTSNVTEFRMLLKNFVPSCSTTALLIEEDTSGCVSHGLTLTIFPEEVEAFRKSLQECTHISDDLASSTTSRLPAIFANQEYGMPKYVKPILDYHITKCDSLWKSTLAKNSSKAMLASDDFMRRINEPISESLTRCSATILHAANENAPKRFPGRLPVLHNAAMGEAAVSANVKDIAKSIVEHIDVRNMLTKVIDGVLAIVGLILCFIPLIGWFIDGIILEYLERDDGKDKLLSPRKLRKVLSAMEDYSKILELADAAVKKVFSDPALANEVKKPLVQEAASYITLTHFDVDILPDDEQTA